MKSLFVDTGGWMTCADPAYEEANALREHWLELGGHSRTTDPHFAQIGFVMKP